MLARVLALSLAVAIAPTIASAGVEIHATCASAIAIDPGHVRTLRAELARALDGIAEHYALDVSLVRLEAVPAGRELEVRAEVRALLSDAQGRVVWSTTTHAKARGAAHERKLLERDAVTAAAGDVAKTIRRR